MKRTTIDMSAEGVERLEEIKELSGFSSDKELFDAALTLFDWAMTVSKEGRRIVSTDKDFNTYRELDMPSFEIARKFYDKSAKSVDKNLEKNKNSIAKT